MRYFEMSDTSVYIRNYLKNKRQKQRRSILYIIPEKKYQILSDIDGQRNTDNIGVFYKKISQ